MMKNNLLILCLEKNISKIIQQKLAEQLDLFFVDVDDLLQFNMVDKNMLENAGREYFESEQKKVILSISEYDNALVGGKISNFFKDDTIRYFQPKFIIVYLKYSKEDIQKFQNSFYVGKNASQNNLLAFKEEDEACQKISDMTVLMTDDNEKNIDEIKKSLLNLVREYEKH